MKPALLTFCCYFIFTINLKAQISKDFEGVITYSHNVTAINHDYNIDRDFGYIGKQSDFYYKSGRYKWLNQNAFMQMDMYRNMDTVEFLKMQSTDTILYAPNNFSNEKVKDYKIFRNEDTVLGHICNVLVINATSAVGDWTRRYSFSKEFSINPTLFENYKYNSTNIIYSLMKALPLKIELIYQDRKITYLAIKIQKKAIRDDFFEFNSETNFKSLM